MGMVGKTPPGDFSCGHFQRRKKTRRPMPDVIVCHPGRQAGPHRKNRLRPIESLDLRLLIHAQDKGFFRRVEVKPHHVGHLSIEVRIGTELEALGPMRLEPVLFQHPMSRHGTDLRPLSQKPHAPVRPTLRRLHRGRHDPRFIGRRDPPLSAAPVPRVQARDPLLQEPLPPLAHRHLRDLEPFGHRSDALTVGARQDHPSTLGHLLWSRWKPHPTLQHPSISHLQLEFRSHVSHDT